MASFAIDVKVGVVISEASPLCPETRSLSRTTSSDLGDEILQLPLRFSSGTPLHLWSARQQGIWIVGCLSVSARGEHKMR